MKNAVNPGTVATQTYATSADFDLKSGVQLQHGIQFFRAVKITLYFKLVYR